MCLYAFIVSIALCHAENTTLGQHPTAEVRIEPANRSILLGENLCITIRVRNTTDRDILLSGFEIGYQIPNVECRRTNGQWEVLHRKANYDSDLRPAPVTLKRGEELVHEGLLFQGFMAFRGFSEPGPYELRARMPVGAIDPQSKALVEVTWSAPTQTISVLSPSGNDKIALLSIIEFQDNLRHKKDVPRGAIMDFRIRFYREFLREYAQTPYANEIRQSLAGTLGILADTLLSEDRGNGTSSNQSRVAELRRERASLLETIATQGRPYARHALPRLVDTYLSLGDQEAIRKAKQAADRWVELEPDNPRAVWRRSTIEGGAPQSRPSTQPGGG